MTSNRGNNTLPATRITTIPVRHLWQQGLWSENPGLVKLLGLCPLLAVSNNAANGLGLGLATLLTLLIANVAISAMRNVIATAIRIPVYVLVIASTVTVIELLMQAWLPALHASLGIFLPLIVTNCLIIGRAEAFASRHALRESLHDALSMGLGFLWVLVLLGALRELLGQGTLLADSGLLLGHSSQLFTWQVYGADRGMLIALLPPGAFFALGLLLAGKNWLDSRLARRTHSVAVDPPSTQATVAAGENPQRQAPSQQASQQTDTPHVAGTR